MKVVLLGRPIHKRFEDLRAGETFVTDGPHDWNIRMKVDVLLREDFIKGVANLLKGQLAVNLSNGALVEIEPNMEVFPRNVEAVERSNATKI